MFLIYLHDFIWFFVFHYEIRYVPVYYFCCFEAAVLVGLGSDYYADKFNIFLLIHILTAQTRSSIGCLSSFDAFVPVFGVFKQHVEIEPSLSYKTASIINFTTNVPVKHCV